MATILFGGFTEPPGRSMLLTVGVSTTGVAACTDTANATFIG